MMQLNNLTVTTEDILNSYSYSAVENCPICRSLQRLGFQSVDFNSGDEKRANFTHLNVDGKKYKLNREAANITQKRANRQILAAGYEHPNDWNVDADLPENKLPPISVKPFNYSLTEVEDK